MNTRRCSSLLLLSVWLILLSACSPKPLVLNHAEKFSGHGSHDVYVVSHGWHTGFVVDGKQLLDKIPELRSRFEGARYIEFGWGDKGFYQAEEITSGLTLRAIFWPTESVMHVVAVPQDVIQYFAHSKVERLCMNNSEFSSLVSFIESSFYRDDDGQFLLLRNGIYGDSQFYKGVGDYYLMNTCNKWTAKGLKSAGMDISPTFKLTAGSVMNFVAAYNLQNMQSSDLPLTSSFPVVSNCQ